jgi:hypothetical protein
MKPAELYNLWAPKDSIWSNWAKPLLFADSSYDDLATASSPDWRLLNIPRAPAAGSGTAVVVDLPGLDSVKVGMALTQNGYRPVPLFNGAPGPALSGPFPLVDVYPIVRALHGVANDLAALQLPPNAPPAFLLDANRFAGSNFPSPGHFDNRWCAFPQDFPSANFLLSQNIRSVLLVQKTSTTPQRDLSHVLMAWQETGIQILSCGEEDASQPTPIQVQKPYNFRSLWYRAMVVAGLRRNSAGGFGAVIPIPNSGGGGFG